MNKLFFVMSICISSLVFAGPGPALPPHHAHHGPRVHHAPPPPMHHPHNNWWGRGGCNFWPSFIGGAVGAAVGTSIVQ